MPVTRFCGIGVMGGAVPNPSGKGRIGAAVTRIGAGGNPHCCTFAEFAVDDVDDMSPYVRCGEKHYATTSRGGVCGNETCSSDLQFNVGVPFFSALGVV